MGETAGPLTVTREVDAPTPAIGLEDPGLSLVETDTTRSYVSWRKAIDSAEVPAQLMRERLDAHLYALTPHRRELAAAMADRFMRWYTSGMGTVEAARVEGMTPPRMSNTIKAMAGIALNPELDVAENVAGAIIGFNSEVGAVLPATREVESAQARAVVAIEGARTPRHNWRQAIDDAEIPQNIMMARLNNSIDQALPRTRKAAAHRTLRFLRWYEGGLKTSTAARSEHVTGATMLATISWGARVVLDDSRDHDGEVRDWIGEAKLAPSSKSKSTERPTSLASPVGFRPSISSDWFVEPVHLGMPRVRSRHAEDYDGDDNPLAWQTDALCAQTDPEAFFPEKGGSTRDAKKICTSCEVKAQCLDYALSHDERFGIWGGLSERERRRLRRVRTA